MSWLESQIETRARLDAEMSERAYAELAASVSGASSASFVGDDNLEQTDAAIGACLRYNGVVAGKAPESLADLEQRIEWLCRPTGTMHRAIRLDRDWYKRAFGAILGTLDTGQVVALLPRGVRGYSLVDPATGKRLHITAEVASHIQPDAVFFYRPLPARAIKVADLARFIVSVFDRTDYALAFAASLAVTLIGLLPAWAHNIAFGTVVPSGRASLIAPVAALLAGVAISTILIGICRNLVMSRVATKLDVTTEAATFSRLLSLPPSFFKQYSSGDLASRVSNVRALVQTIVSIALGSALSGLLSLVYVCQVGAYTPALAVPALIIALVQAGLTVVVTLITRRYEKVAMESGAKLSGTVTALLNGIQKIKLAGAEERAFATWAHGYADHARAVYNRPAVLRALPALVGLIGLVGNIAIYYLAGATHVGLASYMAFNVAFGQITGAIMGVANVAGQIAQMRPMLEMAEPILEAEPEVASDKPNVDSLTGAIEVSGVSFRYDEHSPYVIKDLDLKIRPGEYVAIVGKSGCGKSTIMRLLLGFEKPERGTIFYGPYDVSKVDLRSLRSHIGVVMQDGKLFMGDIQNNITISNPTATVDDAWAAAEIAGIAETIRKMPMGMQTIVTEGGGGISGGQRQRLMIARAVCGKKRILMLDEATSALDNRTQKHVADALEQLKCTRIVVAHRLSTVRHCDRILVVDGGTIAEEGTYDELIAKDGLFAELVARQRLDNEG